MQFRLCGDQFVGMLKIICSLQFDGEFDFLFYPFLKNRKIAPSCDSYLNILCYVFYTLNSLYCGLCIVFSAFISNALYSFNSMNCNLCIVFYAFYYRQWILLNVFYAFFSLHCNIYIVSNALFYLHFILWFIILCIVFCELRFFYTVFYELYSKHCFICIQLYIVFYT